MSYALSSAQQMTEGEDLNANGLVLTYHLMNKENVQVGGQNFDKYKVVATAKNNTGISFNLRVPKYPATAEIGTTRIADLNCLNATGAKLTSKKATLRMTAHIIKVAFPGMAPRGAYYDNRLVVPASYYFDAGQTIEDNVQFIVPQGEDPKISARVLLGP